MIADRRSDPEALAQFSKRILDASQWPSRCSLAFPYTGLDPVAIFREAYAALSPAGAALPAASIDVPGCSQNTGPFSYTIGPNGDGYMSARGDGILVETKDRGVTPGADQVVRYHLIIGDDAYMVTSYASYDHYEPDQPDPDVFTVRAHSPDALERAIAVLVERLSTRGAALTKRDDA